MDSCSRSNVDNIVTFSLNILIVFDNYDTIANGRQPLEIRL